jgi:hypothetical protein
MSLGFGFKIVDPGFILHYNLREEALSSVLCGMGAKVQWLFRSCLFMCFCQHSWHLTSTELGTVKHFSKRHYTDFTDGQDGGQFICFYVTVGACLFTNPADVWHHCIASATTPRFVMKCCSSCFIIFITSYLSRRAFISAVASTLGANVPALMQVGFSLSSSEKSHVNCWILVSTMVLLSVERNSCE